MHLNSSICIIFLTSVVSDKTQLYASSLTLSSSSSWTNVGLYRTNYDLENNNGIGIITKTTAIRNLVYHQKSLQQRKSNSFYQITTRRDALSILQAKTNDNDDNDNDNKETTIPPNQIKENKTLFNLLIITTPFLIALSSYLFFPTTFYIFSSFISFFLSNNSQLPQETTNSPIEISSIMGVVITVLSILYGNIISSTVFVLRQRRQTIHGSLNVEAVQVRSLYLLLQYLPMESREKMKEYLKNYVETVAQYECSATLNDKKLKGRNKNLIQIRSELNHLSSAAQTDNNNASTPTTTTTAINSNILEQAYNTLDCLSTHRLERITALQSTYSVMHWINIFFLSIVITTMFLLQVYDLVETKQLVSGGAEAFELRLVFSMLMGIFTMLFCITYDLANPFVGSYQIPLLIGEDDDELYDLFSD